MSFEIKTDRLRVEIAEPGEGPNRNCRFAYAGYVSEIILDDMHRFGATEPNHINHPSSHGRGLCGEFNFDASPQAKVGEWFPKVGVGLLKKTNDEPYTFYKMYEKKDYPISYEKTDSKAVFKVEAIPCMGYAIEHMKTVEVTGTTIVMTEMIKNVGEKEFVSLEYNHNMLTIDGLALSPAYKFRLPNMTDRGKGLINGTIRGDGYGYTFSSYNRDPAFFEIDVAGLHDCDDKFVWSMLNSDASANPDGQVSVTGTEFYKPVKLMFWAVDHLMSLEVFQELHVKPGQSHEWKRTWEFNC